MLSQRGAGPHSANRRLKPRQVPTHVVPASLGPAWTSQPVNPWLNLGWKLRTKIWITSTCSLLVTLASHGEEKNTCVVFFISRVTSSHHPFQPQRSLSAGKETGWMQISSQLCNIFQTICMPPQWLCKNYGNLWIWTKSQDHPIKTIKNP